MCKLNQSRYLGFDIQSNDGSSDEPKTLRVIVSSKISMNDPNEICSICMIKVMGGQEEPSLSGVSNKEKSPSSDVSDKLNLQEGDSNEEVELGEVNQYNEIFFEDDEGYKTLHTSGIIQLYNCKHSFHETCINRWLKYAVSCPICRVNVTSRV
mmetsp:Transcript_10134/g.11556  ORF Transcript_10134/g.11556 Transcript_10134/m.11556 type:complete len:153 (-) Transcript_10134:34-492(-)